MKALNSLEKSLAKLIEKVKNNALEYWTAVVILVLLPLSAYLYFDYRAAILVFAILNSIIGVLALRGE